MDKKILVLGGTSFLGLYILRELERRGISCTASTRMKVIDIEIGGVQWFQVDILQVGTIEALLNQVDPDIIINCIALSTSTQCDAEPPLAWAINTSFVEHLVSLCEHSGIRLYHLSTDFVFDAQSMGPFDEDAHPKAATDLGNTKMMGEIPVIQSNIGHVIRLSTIWGKNLLEGRKSSFAWDAYSELRQGKSVDIYSNVYRTPVLAHQAAESIVDLVLLETEKPIVHITENNFASNYESFIRIESLDIGKVNPVDTDNTPHKLGLKTKFPEFSKKLNFEQGLRQVFTEDSLSPK